MASPHVTGAAALLLAKEPHLSYLDLKSRLLNSADRIPSLAGKVVTGCATQHLQSIDGVDAR